MYNHIFSCLFSGNAIALKMSECSCLSVTLMLRIARTALETNKHDPDLICDITGFAEAGQALISLVDKVIFTGSPGVGVHVMRAAATRLTPCVLELGGKDPVIVCDSAPLDDVIPIVMRGTFQGSGQNCIGIERVLVFASVHDEFVRKVTPAVRALRQGRPLDDEGNWRSVDVGATTTPEQAAHVLELIADARRSGAKIVVGGEENAEAVAEAGGGVYVRPTLVVGVTEGMRIFREEVFGPVMCVVKVKGDSEDEAVRLANATQYGLGSNVYSRSIPQAERIAARLEAGMTNVNDMALNYMAQSLPFGGVKNSGYGRFAGREGLRECCRIKSVTSGKPTILPAALGYPIEDRSHKFIGGMMDTFYGTSISQRVAGTMAMLWQLGIGGVIQQML